MTTTIKRTGFTLRRPRGTRRSVTADIQAPVISRHRTARSALTALRTQERSANGYSADFIFDESAQVAVSNYEADSGAADRGRGENRRGKG